MSLSLMTKAWGLDISSTKKIVMLALCDCANDQGECYPSISTLYKKCSLSERGVQKAITELEKDGYLHRDMRKGRSTVYWLTPARGAPLHDLPPAPRAPAPAPRAPQPPHHVHPTPAPRAPRNVIEPSIESLLNQNKEKPKKKTAFKPPTQIELMEYAKENSLTLRGMFDYYESNGWMVGRNKMKDWKAAARNWSNRNNSFNEKKQQTGHRHEDFSKQDYGETIINLPGFNGN